MQKTQKVLGILLLIAGATSYAMADIQPVPEIVAGSAGSAVALVSGIVLMFRSRRK